MNATKATIQTEKQVHRLCKKYLKYGLRQTRKSIRQARKAGEFHATAYIFPRNFYNGEVLSYVRKIVIDFLESNGYYVREYSLCHRIADRDPEEVRFAWGKDIAIFRKIDVHQREYVEAQRNNNEGE